MHGGGATMDQVGQAQTASSRRRSSRMSAVYDSDASTNAPTHASAARSPGGAAPTQRRPQLKGAMRDSPGCSNCGTTETSYWRASPTGAVLCNACGQYYSRRKQMRPVGVRWIGNKWTSSIDATQSRDPHEANLPPQGPDTAPVQLAHPTEQTLSLSPNEASLTQSTRTNIGGGESSLHNAFYQPRLDDADKENTIPFESNFYDRIKQNSRNATKKYASHAPQPRSAARKDAITTYTDEITMSAPLTLVPPPDDSPANPAVINLRSHAHAETANPALFCPGSSDEINTRDSQGGTNSTNALGIGLAEPSSSLAKRSPEAESESPPRSKRARSISGESEPTSAHIARHASGIQQTIEVASQVDSRPAGNQAQSGSTSSDQSTNIAREEIQRCKSSTTFSEYHRIPSAQASPDAPSRNVSAGETLDISSKLLESVSRAERDIDFIAQVEESLHKQSRWKTANVGKRQARRIVKLLKLAKAPSAAEALFLTGEAAKEQLKANKFFGGPIFTENQQPLELQTIDGYLDEQYDDESKVYIQDPEIRLAANIPGVREVTVGKLKEHFAKDKLSKSLNCLELAAHVEDGLRPAFLNVEDCRLLTKLKHPSLKDEEDQASRRGYRPGWKEVEKWALLAKAGALTEPHQDSHGYSTYITVNQGIIGFGWLANPTAEQRAGWRRDPVSFIAGEWRISILRPGETVFFPAGTVHFVFRHPGAGDTLAFGGHVLRCSQIVRWVQTLLEEQETAYITNEDLTTSAPGYLARVEKFVRQARKTGQEWKWGGTEAIDQFLKLKEEFLSKRECR